MNYSDSASNLEPELIRSSRSVSDHPRHAIVAGASGGIGLALCNELTRAFPDIRMTRLARQMQKLPQALDNNVDVALDLCNPQGIENAVSQLDPVYPPDWILVSSGWLHDEQYKPEKTFRQLNASHLAYAFQVNTIGPVILLQQLVQRFWSAHEIKIGVLSARVGSISDNRLGGWYAYRASKASLNMLLKNFAIELARSKPDWCVVGLHPGTTDTPLSSPYQQRLPAGQLQSAQDTARRLIGLMLAFDSEDTGKLYDHFGCVFTP